MSEGRDGRRGLRAVLLSIAVAGVLGYVIQLSAPALTDDTTYIAFSVFWSTIYLGGSAMAGVQQEVARAAYRSPGGGAGRTAAIFALCLSGVVLVAAALVAVLFGRALLPGDEIVLGWTLALGFVGYLMMSVLTGILYGIGLWRAVAFIAILDAGLRAALVVSALLLGGSLQTLMIFVAAPFLVAFSVTLLVFRKDISGAFALDVGLRQLLAHTLGTVVAASSSGLLISGMPMLIGALTNGITTQATAALILAITVTRAPIVVPIIALQSFLISTVLRGRDRMASRRLLTALAMAFGVIVVLATAAWWLGPPIISFISASKYSIEPGMASAIVCSAGLVAVLSLTGPMLIVARRHALNALGWLGAAALTILLLGVGTGAFGVACALVLPPLAGLGIHLLGMRAVERTAIGSTPGGAAAGVDTRRETQEDPGA